MLFPVKLVPITRALGLKVVIISTGRLQANIEGGDFYEGMGNAGTSPRLSWASQRLQADSWAWERVQKVYRLRKRPISQLFTASPTARPLTAAIDNGWTSRGAEARLGLVA